MLPPFPSTKIALIARFTIVVASLALSIGQLQGRDASAQPLTLTAGPFVEIADEVVGPYRLIVQQSPERVILGTLALAVQVHSAEDGTSVPDAIVKVYGTPAEHGVRQVAPALNTPVDREFYIGRLEVEDTGVWAIDVSVEHHELGAANLTLATEVFDRSRGGSNLLLGTIMWVGVSLAFIGIVWYLVRKSRKTREELARASASTQK